MSICNSRGDTAQFARNACTICAVVMLNLSGETALAERNMQFVSFFVLLVFLFKIGCLITFIIFICLGFFLIFDIIFKM